MGRVQGSIRRLRLVIEENQLGYGGAVRVHHRPGVLSESVKDLQVWNVVGFLAYSADATADSLNKE